MDTRIPAAIWKHTLLNFSDQRPRGPNRGENLAPIRPRASDTGPLGRLLCFEKKKNNGTGKRRPQRAGMLSDIAEKSVDRAHSCAGPFWQRCLAAIAATAGALLH